MHKLNLHPECVAVNGEGAVTHVEAGLEPTQEGCLATFTLAGDMGRVKIPAQASPDRTDLLWQTTCFEIFWQPIGTSSYREFNLSPSTRWAAYDFDDFRENARDAAVESVAIACKHDAGSLTLTAKIAADLPVPAKVALNAIVEEMDGQIQFSALAFPDGRPEFHSEACRQLIVESR